MPKRTGSCRIDVSLIVAVTILFLATGGMAASCFIEEEFCSVCWKAGAMIPCVTGSGWVNCPDELLSNDAPYRIVVTANSGYHNKRSENYGSCSWQPMIANTSSDPNDPPCIPNGPPKSIANVLGEETHGSECAKTPGGGKD